MLTHFPVWIRTATTQTSEAERDTQLQALDDALSEMRANAQADTEVLAGDIAAVAQDLAENTSNDKETITTIQKDLASLEARFDASLHNEVRTAHTLGSRFPLFYVAFWAYVLVKTGAFRWTI